MRFAFIAYAYTYKWFLIQITKKKQGVSGESSTPDMVYIKLKHFDKDLR